jgi:phosphatidylethanolamine/phosphatidyl-N-methylethanolamine N-methyltransferase
MALPGNQSENQKTNMQLLAKLSATTLFLQEWITCPKEVGAIVPSSKNLAVAMARPLPPESDGYALELGPGTGAVTEALLERGLSQERLIAIERSPKMAELLRKRFPRANVINGDAFQLDTLLHRHASYAENICAVFSSLPLLNFEPKIADDLAKKIRSILRPGGKLVQYSYHLFNRQPKAAAHFRYVASDLVWFNVPPARVSVYEK